MNKLVKFLFVLALFFAFSLPLVAQDATEEPEIIEVQYARTTVETQLYTSNGTVRVLVEDGDLKRGEEVIVVGEYSDWVNVQKFNGLTGWVRIDEVELAELREDGARLYGQECLYTPVSVERTEGSVLRRWQHRLAFNIDLPRDWELRFNSDSLVEDENFRAVEAEPAIFELSAGWVTRHSADLLLGVPGWADLPYWTLVLLCDELAE